jgi:acylphosphatase
MAYEIILKGRVQGVGCRYYCGNVARKSGIRGSASNLRDGSVRVIAETDDFDSARAFASALKDNVFGLHFYGRIESVELYEVNNSRHGEYEW